ncbi:MAG: AAA family ATPase [Caldilineaceae bacterium]
MSSYRLLKHKNYDRSAEHLPEMIQRKAIWAQVLLGMRGRTPSVKGTTGLNARWRRTPVQGNHYYMWWIPGSESNVVYSHSEVEQAEKANNTILIHSIRHHDETDDPIELGSLDDYEEVAVDKLDPRFAEQYEVSERVNSEYVALATIKGMPGSGKTVSLLYLVKDLAQRLDMQKILYVTYTGRLKRAAREFLQAQGEAINRIVKISTLSEIEQEITGLATYPEPFTELRDFITFLDLQNAATLGPWKRYPQTLYTELRAHLLGKTFPPGYSLPDGKLNELLFKPGGVSPSAYAASREVALPDAELAWRLAERTRNTRFFQDQKAAYQAIERLRKGKSPAWLADLDALIIDEVQDLTLLQLALLGELVRERMRRRKEAHFVFTVAGDESQIVQPSGFDWGITKNLLGEQLGLWPDEFEFQHQRRAPRNLAQLIDNTWTLYGHLPRSHRPSARRQSFIYADDPADAENGQIFICPLPEAVSAGKENNQSWNGLLEELADKPGRVIVDLTEKLRASLANQLGPNADEVIFLPREIKGLERATVLVHGLNMLYERGMQLCATSTGDNIPKFEARRLFDEIRVALSRCTDKLVLLEPANAPVLTELAVHQVPGALTISWQDLLELLQLDDMSELEVIEGYLDEVDDLFERNMWEQGYRRNRRAYSLAVQLDDFALQRDAQEQYIGGYLQEATSLLHNNQWRQAHTRNRQAQALAIEFGDPLLEEQVDDQFVEIARVVVDQTEQQMAQARTRLQQQQYKLAYQAVQSAGSMAALTQEARLIAQVDELLTDIVWQWTGHLVSGAYTEEDARTVVKLLTEAAEAMTRQADAQGASALRVVAERYQVLPQATHLTSIQVESLLNFIWRYLEVIKPLNVGEAGYSWSKRWLEEAFANLHNATDLYQRWLLVAQEYEQRVAYAELDDHLWDLENRVALLLEQGKRSPDDRNLKKFKALVMGYQGEAEAASAAWEQLGELEIAADYAREAGDMERAYDLFRQSKVSIPEELAVTVKALRLLQQLEHKHQGLRPAERRQLLEHLAALHTAVASSETLEDGGASTDAVQE